MYSWNLYHKISLLPRFINEIEQHQPIKIQYYNIKVTNEIASRETISLRDVRSR